MKKITLSLAFGLFFSVAGFAQDRTQPVADARTKAYKMTRIMADNLRLNESEYIRVRTLNEERMAEAAQAAALYQNDPELKDSKLKEIEEQFDRQLQALLSPRQLEAYLVFKENPPVNYSAFLSEEAARGKK